MSFFHNWIMWLQIFEGLEKTMDRAHAIYGKRDQHPETKSLVFWSFPEPIKNLPIAECYCRRRPPCLGTVESFESNSEVTEILISNIMDEIAKVSRQLEPSETLCLMGRLQQQLNTGNWWKSLCANYSFHLMRGKEITRSAQSSWVG